MKIENVIIPLESDETVCDVQCSTRGIEILDRHHSSDTDSPQAASPPSLLLPPLCHPHIHLDKAYLLTSNTFRPRQPQNQHKGDSATLPDYSDLAPESGTLREALSLTSKAKSRYTLADLLQRGSQLIAESITYGVTSMRAFIEIDHVTQFKCLEAAIQLKAKFAPRCHVQICAFAQDPVMSGDFGAENQRLMELTLDKYADQIEVLGTTPYVEVNYDTGLENVKWAINTALKKGLHLDFHLDYNLDPDQKAMVSDVVKLLHESNWTNLSQDKRVVLGHCTRMTLFSDEELKQLKAQISDLPLSFVGLPTSDLFMMGRPSEGDRQPGIRQRGTLQILHMIQNYGFDACIGVNNVGNAFTPWASPDPLKLASLGVGLYQGGTIADARTLFECVSIAACKAIGIHDDAVSEPQSESDRPRFVSSTAPVNGLLLAIDNETYCSVEGIEDQIVSRQRRSIKDVVWDPPERHLRRLVST